MSKAGFVGPPAHDSPVQLTTTLECSSAHTRCSNHNHMMFANKVLVHVVLEPQDPGRALPSHNLISRHPCFHPPHALGPRGELVRLQLPRANKCIKPSCHGHGAVGSQDNARICDGNDGDIVILSWARCTPSWLTGFQGVDSAASRLNRSAPACHLVCNRFPLGSTSAAPARQDTSLWICQQVQQTCSCPAWGHGYQTPNKTLSGCCLVASKHTFRARGHPRRNLPCLLSSHLARHLSALAVKSSIVTGIGLMNQLLIPNPPAGSLSRQDAGVALQGCLQIHHCQRVPAVGPS
jgi:hypothetical protein